VSDCDRIVEKLYRGQEPSTEEVLRLTAGERMSLMTVKTRIWCIENGIDPDQRMRRDVVRRIRLDEY
jgi:hypothetical protein